MGNSDFFFYGLSFFLTGLFLGLYIGFKLSA